MGDWSYLRFVPSSSATIPIDWAKVPEASKKFLLEGYGIDFSETETDTESDSNSEGSTHADSNDDSPGPLATLRRCSTNANLLAT